MKPFGICHLSLIPLRKEPAHHAEMFSQMLFGECFEVLEQKKEWLRVTTLSDKQTGWITTGQCMLKESLQKTEKPIYAADLVDYVTDPQGRLKAIVLGADLSVISAMEHRFDGKTVSGIKPKNKLVEFGLMYLNSPALPGGKSPFGIDNAGLVHMAYKLSGHSLSGNLTEQTLQGENLSFIEEAEAGDLVFFDDEHGQINHVGLLMQHHHVLHADQRVRIDPLDQHGIYNPEEKRHTHSLRLIKKII